MWVQLIGFIPVVNTVPPVFYTVTSMSYYRNDGKSKERMRQRGYSNVSKTSQAGFVAVVAQAGFVVVVDDDGDVIMTPFQDLTILPSIL